MTAGDGRVEGRCGRKCLSPTLCKTLAECSTLSPEGLRASEAAVGAMGATIGSRRRLYLAGQQDFVSPSVIKSKQTAGAGI